MITPTGYSALDLVGFTDKGTYSSSATYVKNDLVHYNNDIWICKLDDTTGQTPSAGAYWELWLKAGNSIANMTDVNVVSPVKGQVMVYNPETSKWENKPIGYVDGERAIIGVV